MTPWLHKVRSQFIADHENSDKLETDSTCHLHTVVESRDGYCLQGGGHPPDIFRQQTTLNHPVQGEKTMNANTRHFEAELQAQEQQLDQTELQLSQEATVLTATAL